MSVTATHCRILGNDVLRMTKLGGYAAQVVCPEFEAAAGSCRMKREADEAGRLDRLVLALGDFTAVPGDIRCTELG